MSGETIRDVIIKIRLQQERAKLQAPDLSDFRRQIDTAAQAVKDLQAGKGRTLSAAQVNLSNSLGDDFGLPSSKKAPGGAASATNDQTKAIEALANAERQALSVSRQRIEAYIGIGEGSLRAARGVAFLTASTADDLRVALAYVSAAQGVVDVYSGTSGVIKNLIGVRLTYTGVSAAATAAEATLAGATAIGTAADVASVPAKVAKVGATRAETVALGQAAIAQTALATSTRATTVATWGQTVAQTALNTAMAVSPAGWAAIAASVAIAGTAYLVATKSTEEMNAAIDKNNGRLKNLGQDWEKLAEQASRGAEALSLAGKEFDAAMKLIQQRQVLPNANAEDALRQMQDEAIARRSQLDDARDRGNLGVGVIGSARTDLEKNRIDTSVLQAELDLRIKQTEEMRKQRQLASDALELSKRTVEEAKRQFESKEERFGRLNPSERSRLEDLSKRVERGDQLSEQDARFLDQTGFGQGLSSAFFRKRGQEAGSAEILGRLGEANELEQAKRNLSTNIATFGETIKDLDEQLDRVPGVIKPIIDKIAEKVGKALGLEDLIKGIEAEQARAKQNQAARDVNK